MRRDIFQAGPAELISPYLGNSNGGLVTVSFWYKVHVWSANTVPAVAPFGTIEVQYGPSATGPWTIAGSITDEVQIASCQGKSVSFVPPAGPLHIRWNCLWTGGDNWWNFDNIIVTEVQQLPCSTPTPGNTVGPSDACVGKNFTLSLQNSTPGQIISHQWFASTTSASGPWSPVGVNAPTLVTQQSVASWYYCRVTCSVGLTVGNSVPLAVPMAVPASPQPWSTGTVTPNCWATQQIAGTGLPLYSTASGFGLGTGCVQFNFWAQAATTENALVSPPFAPLGTGTFVQFDAAGSSYQTSVDVLFVEASTDGGTTWNTLATLDNAPSGGVLNTAPASGSSFVPAAADWITLGFPLSPGTNRLRFRGDSDFGNNLYLDNVAVTTSPPAYHTTVGAGCYDRAASSLVQEFAGSVAAKAALDGNALRFVRSGSHYVATWLPGGASGFVAPSGSATNLTFSFGDDGDAVLTPSIATPIPGGVATQWTVSANGILTAGNVANHSFDVTPARDDVAAATGLAFYTWRDWNPLEAGSGPIQAEQVGSMFYVTWNAVEAYGFPSPNRGTWQFQIDLANGTVTIVWVSFETSTSPAITLVGATLAGTSALPPSTSLATMPPFAMNGDYQALSLSAAGAPINNGAAPTYTIANIPASTPGGSNHTALLAFSLSGVPGGFDLDTPPYQLGIPGCSGYLGSLDVVVLLGTFANPSVSFPIPWSVPGTPLQIWMQAIAQVAPGSLPNGQPGEFVTSNALQVYIENY
ncbi:MAG: hypothetical protein U1F60_00545 [Planctomycetota bacterium]